MGRGAVYRELLLPAISHAVNTIAFSPDGKLLAADCEDGTVVVWDVARRRPLHEPLRGHRTAVCVVAFSSDSKTLAFAGTEIIFWDVVTGQPLGEPPGRANAFVNGLAFSPDGKLFSSAGDDATVRLWDRITGRAIGAPLALWKA